MRFDSYHPTINLIYFASVIGCTLCFRHPVFIAISYACALAYSVYLGGPRALRIALGLVPGIVIWTLCYASYNHFGVTPLHQNVIGNQITLEALVFGAVIGIKAAATLMWLGCFNAVFCTDKIAYLFGRISPKLSLYIAILFRMTSRIRTQRRKLMLARRGIGMGSRQDGIINRIRNCAAVFSALITWTSETMIRTAESMRCRGYSLQGRTAFSIYRFDNRDRALVLFFFGALTVIMIGVLLDQTNAVYAPVIFMNQIQPLSCIFYSVYFVFCNTPALVIRLSRNH